MNIKNSILETIGDTPLINLKRIENHFKLKSKLLAKVESFNPYSVKDRVALNMINTALSEGKLSKGGYIIEPTSGNTGIGLAMAAAVSGFKAVLVMPESMSIERRKLLKALGAEIVLSPAADGMSGAVRVATRLVKERNGYMPSQFENSANPEAHKNSTALEIIKDTDGDIDYFVSAVGTGGTLTGVGKVLKEQIKGVKIIAVQPLASPVLTGGTPAPHNIQGIGANFIPQILDTALIDSIISVSDSDAAEFSRILAKTEGILCGISSGAALFAAVKTAEKNPHKKIVLILPDSGERYMSTCLFED